jgi:hypothetical protein
MNDKFVGDVTARTSRFSLAPYDRSAEKQELVAVDACMASFDT